MLLVVTVTANELQGLLAPLFSLVLSFMTMALLLYQNQAWKVLTLR